MRLNLRHYIRVQQGAYKKTIKRMWLSFMALWLMLAIYIFSVSIDLFGLFGPLPSFKLLDNPRNDLASEVYSSDGVLMGKYFRENRTPVAYEEISSNVINALIATEDARFEKHSGVDFRSLGRVLFKSILLLQEDEGGGSTITQQLAKNLYKLREEENAGLLDRVPLVNTLIIKTKEWITAINLEENYTKKEIITLYLNTVDFGSNAYGIRSAAKTFFKKTPSELSVPEAALLIGMLNNPVIFNPVNYPANARNRRNIVLSKMEKYGYLPHTQYTAFIHSSVKLNYEVENQTQGVATYFRGYIMNELLKWAKEHDKDLFADGLKIHTTIDYRMQQYAEEVLQEHMQLLQKKFFEHWKGRNPWVNKNMQEIEGYIERTAARSSRYKALQEKYTEHPDSVDIVMRTPVPMRVFSWEGEIDTVMSPMDSIRYYKHFLHTGMMAMDPNTGHVKVWVGGINYKHFQYDHVKQGRRQPGSVFKPFIYAAAIDHAGYAPCDQFLDISPVFPEFGNWMARNYSRTYSDSLLTLREAMAQSKNTVPAYLIKQMGVTTVIDYIRQLGITSSIRPWPSIGLGTEAVSVYEMVGAYSTFVNQGVWTKPIYITRIEDRNGNVVEEFSVETKEVLSEEKAYLMLHMLKGSLQERGGTSMGLYQYDATRNNEVGAKTGTSQRYADGWFIGVTRDLAAGVWVGGDDMSIHFRDAEGLGSRTALPYWGKFMDKVYADTTLSVKKGTFKKPAKLSVTLDCNRYQKAILIKDSASQYIRPKLDSLAEDEDIL
ncbi:transglycosylase domain-containing protein [Rhodocytophaga aerolata]|uniref:Transglycosylase domain-containing protein n=1 Tax=Rhodocytophaga aerolata TaxID=455078 RepID=A0ABT8R1W7_9BACT|nr:transglycosylase domain-containing protein [Rhodocytophaga aerolata]MDO1446088.1 transglycosylase domain-containing protein [Rhodocytophaga aerolata]